MSSPIHALAKQQAHLLVSLFWDQLPTSFHDNMEQAQFNLELDLATFDVFCLQRRLRGFDLLRAARKRAERYYRQELKQVHHTSSDWAFFRFWLEISLLKTVRASNAELMQCHAWHNVMGEAAYRTSHYCAERINTGPVPTGYAFKTHTFYWPSPN